MGNHSTEPSEFNSDMIHNHNCFAYLFQLKSAINPEIIQLLPYLEGLDKLDEVYNPQYPYGDLYTDLITYLDNRIEQLTLDQLNSIDDLILAIYHNNNQILEYTQWLINPIGARKRPDQYTSEQIALGLRNPGREINRINPRIAEQTLNKIITVLSPNFKPQYETNIPSLISYPYKQSSDATEYRFCTQAQRHEGQVRISPLFKRWLLIKAEKSDKDQFISHVYFNFLGLDRGSSDIPGARERELTLALHQLENEPSLKVAVITLPAYQGLMNVSSYSITDDLQPIKEIAKEFLNISLGKGHESGVSDFWISDQIRSLLFKDKDPASILKPLLARSFSELGFTVTKTPFLSFAQKQAVWVHFIKFELTKYILDTLKPSGYNFTCKDAIDRGAVSSTYFNLMNSFALNNPLTKEEFERALDAPASIVKARGMNFHRKIIWNALDAYVRSHYEQLMSDPKKTWLIYWRDMNCPRSRVEELINERIVQCEQEFDNLPVEQVAIKTAAIKILDVIKTQIEQEVSGKRVLLEIVSRTSELIKQPSKNISDMYQLRANELRIDHANWYVLGGLMKALLGVLLLLPTFGYSSPLISSGLATAKTGFFASDRNKLSNNMLDLETILNPAQTPSPY